MPKNKIGGKKHKGKKNTVKESKELIIPEKNELIGQVTAVKGSGRFDIRCIDGVSRIGILRGTMRKRVWIEVGVLVLIVKWDFQDSKCNIIHKYDDSDIIKLSDMKELESIFITNNKVESNFNEEYDDYDISDEEYINSSDTEENEDINIDDI